MAATNEDIANSALLKLGSEKIVSLSSDTTRRAILANEQFSKIRKKLLRGHPWNFAIKRQFLTLIEEASVSTIDASTDTFTSGSTLNHVTGDRTTITLNSGTLPSPLQAGTTYYFIKVTTTTFQLATTQQNALDGTAIDITDEPTFNADFKVSPPFEFDNKFSLPSDMLRAIREEDKSVDWRKEGSFIIADQATFNLLYVADITDPTEFDESFDELFAVTLAYELAYPLVQSLSLKKQLKEERDEMLRDTRSFDAQEGQPEDLETNEWLLARR